MKEKGQPPVPPGDTSEQTVDFVQSRGPRKPTIDALLPPGADEEPAPPPLAGPILAEFIAPQVGPRESARPLGVPAIDPIASDPIARQRAARAISPEEKAQWRFWKNAIVFGVCLVVLMVVCFLLAR
jgi:hypothetical protein